MLAENLILLRNMKGMSQEQIAEVIGISRQSYAKWEQGETVPDIEKCDRLAKFYDITIDALLHQENTVGNTRLAPAPPGKHLWGTVTIGSKGQIVIQRRQPVDSTAMFLSFFFQILLLLLTQSLPPHHRVQSTDPHYSG